MFRHNPKTPLAWLQLMKEKSRLLVAVAGIAFADLLMFFQLGMLDSLYDSATSPHRNLQADLVLINRRVKTLIDMKSFTRERLQQAVADNGVASVSAVYVGTVGWRNPDTHLERSILLWGIDPVNPAFTLPESSHSEQLKSLNRVLFDRASRPEYGPIADRLTPQGLEIQVSDRFLLVMLMQEALLLAAFGFLPGLVISVGLYRLTYAATLLPIVMKVNRALVVFVLTVLMCGVSGLLATRKLRAVDPADVF